MAHEAEEKTAYQIADEEAQAAHEEAQARYEAAVAEVQQREADERELARLEDRRQYRQFIAGQVYPVLVADDFAKHSKRPVEIIADNAVFLADRLIAALDRAEALDGTESTVQQ